MFLSCPRAHTPHKTRPRLSLSKRYGKDRLEAACSLALTLGTCQYRHVKDILASGRDRVKPATADLWSSPEHDHVRGAGYYQ